MFRNPKERRRKDRNKNLIQAYIGFYTIRNKPLYLYYSYACFSDFHNDFSNIVYSNFTTA